jgi:hypothetical protein
MFRRFVRGLGLVAATIALAAAPAAAQLEANLAGLTDQNAKAYLAPLPDALASTLTSAVFRSGHVPKVGFSLDIGLSAMGVTFDDDDKTYTPTDPPGFTHTGSQLPAPTVIGDPNAVLQPGQGGTTMYWPGGFDMDNFAIAVPQITFGNIMGTRAIARWITIDLGDADIGKLSTFGFGLQHSISQYLTNFPVDVAAGFLYQNFNVDDNLVDANSTQFNVTGSKRFTWVEPYVGVGFDSFSMKTEYESTASGSLETIEVEFDDVNTFHLTAGGSILLSFVKIYGEVNVTEKTAYAAGIAFGK